LPLQDIASWNMGERGLASAKELVLYVELVLKQPELVAKQLLSIHQSRVLDPQIPLLKSGRLSLTVVQAPPIQVSSHLLQFLPGWCTLKIPQQLCLRHRVRRLRGWPSTRIPLPENILFPVHREKRAKGNDQEGFFKVVTLGKKSRKKRQMVFQSTKCKEKIKKNE
jgi:hypothetical protein